MAVPGWQVYYAKAIQFDTLRFINFPTAFHFDDLLFIDVHRTFSNFDDTLPNKINLIKNFLLLKGGDMMGSLVASSFIYSHI